MFGGATSPNTRATTLTPRTCGAVRACHGSGVAGGCTLNHVVGTIACTRGSSASNLSHPTRSNLSLPSVRTVHGDAVVRALSGYARPQRAARAPRNIRRRRAPVAMDPVAPRSLMVCVDCGVTQPCDRGEIAALVQTEASTACLLTLRHYYVHPWTRRGVRDRHGKCVPGAASSLQQQPCTPWNDSRVLCANVFGCCRSETTNGGGWLGGPELRRLRGASDGHGAAVLLLLLLHGGGRGRAGTPPAKPPRSRSLSACGAMPS
jgi:hypothetical protein